MQQQATVLMLLVFAKGEQEKKGLPIQERPRFYTHYVAWPVEKRDIYETVT